MMATQEEPKRKGLNLKKLRLFNILSDKSPKKADTLGGRKSQAAPSHIAPSSASKGKTNKAATFDCKPDSPEKKRRLSFSSRDDYFKDREQVNKNEITESLRDFSRSFSVTSLRSDCQAKVGSIHSQNKENFHPQSPSSPARHNHSQPPQKIEKEIEVVVIPPPVPMRLAEMNRPTLLNHTSSRMSLGKKRSSRDLWFEDEYHPSEAFSLFDESKRLGARELIVREIVTTERTYFAILDNIVKNFLEPLRKRSTADDKITSHPPSLTHTVSSLNLMSALTTSNPPPNSFIVTQGELRIIFSNIETLRNLSQELLRDLEDRSTKWNSQQKIGNIFLRLLPFLRMYSEYCNNHAKAQACFDDCKKRPGMIHFLDKKKKDEIMGQDLPSMLIAPVQRIPRYILLLKDLISKTSPDHGDYAHLTECFEKLKTLGKHLNESIRAHESTLLLVKMSEQLQELKDLVAPHRRLVKQGVMNVRASFRGRDSFDTRCMLLLFNDIVVFIDTQGTLNPPSNEDDEPHKGPSLMLQITAMLMWPETMDGSEFSIGTPEASFIFSASNEEEQARWIRDLNSVLIEMISQQGVGPEPREEKNSPSRRLSLSTNHASPLRIRAQSFSRKSINGRWSAYTFSDRSTYEGGWSQKMRHGYGVQQNIEGSKYEGEFVNDLPDGTGTLIYRNYDKYEGDFVQGLQHGQGVLTMKAGIKYTGSWMNGKMHGRGCIVYGNGDVFHGYFQNGLICSPDETRASITLDTLQEALEDHTNQTEERTPNSSDGDDGQQPGRNDGPLGHASPDHHREEQVTQPKNSMKRKHQMTLEEIASRPLNVGEGKLECSNGDLYRGQWKRNKRDGQGISMTQEDSILYAGEWKEDKKNGRGKSVNKITMEQYDGSWKNDLRHGEGEYTNVMEGIEYYGSFVDDKYEGRGTLTSARDKSLYHGEFKAGQKYGTGKSVQITEATVGRFSLTISTSYEGHWMDKWHGSGILTERKSYASREGKEEQQILTKSVGTWKNGEMEGRCIVSIYRVIDGRSHLVESFEGDFVAGLRSGPGRLTRLDLEESPIYQYDGEYLNGLKNGWGCEVQSIGNGRTVYRGSWVDDKRHGDGSFDDGNSRYEGQWNRDQKNGKGRMTRDGLVFDGQWIDDFLQGECTVIPEVVEPSVGQKRTAVEAELSCQDDQVIGKLPALQMIPPAVPFVRRNI